jgi:hypothetical protein
VPPEPWASPHQHARIRAGAGAGQGALVLFIPGVVCIWTGLPDEKVIRQYNPRPEDRPPPATHLVSHPSSYPCGQAGNDAP